MGRQEAVKREEESGDAGQDRGDQKDGVPGVESFRGKQSEQDNQARKDPDEAQKHMHESQDGHAEDHEGILSVESSAGNR